MKRMQGQNINRNLIRGYIDIIILRMLKYGDNYGFKFMKAVSVKSENEYHCKSLLYISV